MNTYCLKDIHWIYTEDGKFVTPFIINHNDTKIKDVGSDEIYELPDVARTTYDRVASVFAEILRIDENDLIIKQFSRLVIEDVLQLKGLKNSKYAKLKRQILKNGHSDDISSFVVTKEDVRNLTREVIQHFRTTQSKKEKNSENLSNISKAF